jgi:hypothetical protein
MKRKEWFKLAGLGGAAAVSNPFGLAAANREKTGYSELHT